MLKALSDDDIGVIIDRALEDPQRGLGSIKIRLEPDARSTLITLSNGDARSALGTLEFCVTAAPREDDGTHVINALLIADAMQRRQVSYDKAGELHYDITSAFIKSIRGSDPDAAVYWLARMIDGGEDPLFIARRLVILASEDVGLADSRAISVAMAAQQAVHFVGMPEGFFPLAHATLYLATAPKSNSVGRAYGAAMHDVEETRNDPVPLHLRNAPTGLMKQLGYGRDYEYAHESEQYKEHQGDLPPAQRLQAYLPENLQDRQYFEPGSQGDERRLVDWIQTRHKKSGPE
jgi:putative ATPase